MHSIIPPKTPKARIAKCQLCRHDFVKPKGGSKKTPAPKNCSGCTSIIAHADAGCLLCQRTIEHLKAK